MSNPAHFATLGEALDASVAAAKAQGLEVEFELVQGGISYGETRRWSLEVTNKPRSRKCWQVVIERFGANEGPLRAGRYELINYWL